MKFFSPLIAWGDRRSHSYTLSIKVILTMKLICVLLLAFTFGARASGYAQEVNLSLKNATIETVLKEISTQTRLRLFYDERLFENASRVDISVAGSDVRAALAKALRGRNLIFDIMGSTIVIKEKKQTDREISGVVRDASGPMAGVNVTVLGVTGLSARTDRDGRYSIRVPEKAILLFRFMGYKDAEVNVSDKSSADVLMETAESHLDEVIVVGYGTQKKINLSGAVDQIGEKFLESRPITNVGSALQGAMANLNITPTSGRANSSPGINVRGYTSLSGGGPLIVIDGVPATNDELNRMNPMDIASVTVLKDAASAAIYGSRAAFGVVLVTTKSGTTKDIKVTANSIFGAKAITRSVEIEDDPYLVMKYRNIMSAPWYNLYDEKMLEYGKQLSENPSLPRVIVDPQNPNAYIYLGSTDWFKEVYKDIQPSYTNNISIAQKNERSSFYLSGEYYRQNGMLRISPDTYDRYNFRAKGDYKITDWFTLSNNTTFTNDKYDQPSAIDQGYLYWHNVNRQPSLNTVYNPDGTYTEAGVNMIGAVAEGGRSISRNNDFQTSFGAKIDFIKNVWTLNGDATFRRISGKSHFFQLPLAYSTGPNVMNKQNFNSYASNGSSETRYNVYNIYSQYQRTLQDHYFSVMLGFNQEERIYEYFSASRDQLISNSLPTIGLATGQTPSVGASDYSWSVRGAFARLNYTYKDKYILESNLRYDGSSRFPKKDRFAFNPSVSAAWVVSQENFFQPIKGTVSNFKLRGSYGSLANQDLRDNYYPYIANMSKGSGAILDGKIVPIVGSPGLVSSTLTWETITQSNFGVDVGLFKNQFFGSFDIYRRDTKDMLTAGRTLPIVLGTGVPLENAANLKTNGWELTLGYNKEFMVASKPFSFSARLNLADSRAYITKYNNPKNNLNDYYVGQELGEMWGLTTLGFFQSQEEIKAHANQNDVTSYPGTRSLEPGDLKFADINGDGKINRGDWTLDNHGDYKIIGNSRQRYSYGIDLNSSWNGIDLRVFLQGVGKRNYYPPGGDHYFWGIYAQPWASLTKFNLDHWTPENPNAYLPRPKSYVAEQSGIELAATQTKYLQNAGYLRVKNVTLGYTLPKLITDRWGIDRLRLFVSGENLFEFTKLMDYLDPEIVGDRTAYPFQRTYSFGLNFNF
ncbi:TonB-dependent receptor [Sphingobacterium multivorum]|uniref:TonB-dependent receptor n=1 Tax=Sphingobacterium multivorum TaxID=28454 RepID=A0ABX7CR91_SPHMU|nr:TonB-dependent receptor [Sphingobacterium multivorum]QQT54582.1 TonB-dependent receptor [Sphingobacterium multivorum]